MLVITHLQRKSAAGVEGVTWKAYGLASRITDLHSREHREKLIGRSLPKTRRGRENCTYRNRMASRGRSAWHALEDKICNPKVKACHQLLFKWPPLPPAHFRVKLRVTRRVREKMPLLVVSMAVRGVATDRARPAPGRGVGSANGTARRDTLTAPRDW